MSAGNIARHRNYGELMERHDREQKWKRLFKVFIYFLIVAFLSIIFIIVVRWERKKEQKKSAYEYTISAPSPPKLS